MISTYSQYWKSEECFQPLNSTCSEKSMDYNNAGDNIGLNKRVFLIVCRSNTKSIITPNLSNFE